MDEGRFDEALEFFKRAYITGEYDKLSKAISLSHQALALDKLGQFEQAFAKAQEALKLNPNDFLALEVLIKTENQLQSTEFSYDCEEGQYHTHCFHLHQQMIYSLNSVVKLIFFRVHLVIGTIGKKCDLSN